MTHDEHRKRHKLLHTHLDELIADWMIHRPQGKHMDNTTVHELLQWSHQQTIEPVEKLQ